MSAVIKLKKIINEVIYIYRRQEWMLDIKRYLNNYDDVEIDRPIFLLGTQGGGLTLISRMMRRSKKLVSVTGNNDYWSGADEMQNVLWPILPKKLSGVSNKINKNINYKPPYGSLYASDKFLNIYRETKKSAEKEEAEKLKHTMRWIVSRNQKCKKSRFIDKSQVYTVKVSYINKLLQGCKPIFVLVTRNPYAICYRQTTAKSIRMRDISHEKKLELSSTHWKNSMVCALRDSQDVENFCVLKFERVLRETKTMVKKLCNFCDIKFEERMIPSKDHNIPFGTRSKNRWYPIRKNPNKKWIDRASSSDLKKIKQICGCVAKKLGYETPKKLTSLK